MSKFPEFGISEKVKKSVDIVETRKKSGRNARDAIIFGIAIKNVNFSIGKNIKKIARYV